jgi:glucose-6-phosphate 1-dehydrogenase
MEPPASLTAKHLRDENTKVFEAMPPLDVTRVVRGQYRGYQKEPGVDPRSQTETFIAACVEVDNSRWSGVPFFLRTGKSLEERRLVVTLGFKSPTMRMFALDPNIRKARRSNKLVIDFNDPGAIVAHFLAKEPGAAMRLGEATMTFRYADSFSRRHELEGYERLILDAMLGDHSLFTRSEDVERLWEVSTPLLDHPPPVEPYTPGSWGPDSIRHLISPHHWYLPDTP